MAFTIPFQKVPSEVEDFAPMMNDSFQVWSLYYIGQKWVSH
jgi:hypothetical protein